MLPNSFSKLLFPLFAFLLCAAAAFAQDAPAPPVAPPPDPLTAIDPSMLQIAIEGLVVEIKEDRLRQIGLDYDLDIDEVGRLVIENISGARVPSVGAAFSDIRVGGLASVGIDVRALVDVGDAAIRTRPIAVALNNTQVKIDTTDEIPYQDIEFERGNSKLKISKEKVGVSLTVTPSILDINDERNIQLDLSEIKVSAVSNYVNVRGVSRPVFQTAHLATKVLLRDGETLVIAGLKSKRRVTRETGFPFIHRIPILGYLFKYDEMISENTDIVFYITPHILEPGWNPILPFDFTNNEIARDLPTRRSAP